MLYFPPFNSKDVPPEDTRRQLQIPLPKPDFEPKKPKKEEKEEKKDGIVIIDI